MDRQSALHTLTRLASGLDPDSGDPFPPDSPYQRPGTIRALFLVLREMEAHTAQAVASSVARPASRSRPAGTSAENAGKPWTESDDQALACAFDAGKSILDLALACKRSRFAIEARLAKLGKIDPPAGIRGLARPAEPAPATH